MPPLDDKADFRPGGLPSGPRPSQVNLPAKTGGGVLATRRGPPPFDVSHIKGGVSASKSPPRRSDFRSLGDYWAAKEEYVMSLTPGAGGGGGGRPLRPGDAGFGGSGAPRFGGGGGGGGRAGLIRRAISAIGSRGFYKSSIQNAVAFINATRGRSGGGGGGGRAGGGGTGLSRPVSQTDSFLENQKKMLEIEQIQKARRDLNKAPRPVNPGVKLLGTGLAGIDEDTTEEGVEDLSFIDELENL